jgi:hypothetical protein
MKTRGLIIVASVVLAASAARGDWLYGIDTHPHQVAPNVWRFSVNLHARPVAPIGFVGSQFNFSRPEDGIRVDYGFDGAGIDYADGRTFYAIAPTLFDTLDGYINGWNLVDLNDGSFEGLVYATAPLTSVEFRIDAAGFGNPHTSAFAKPH